MGLLALERKSRKHQADHGKDQNRDLRFEPSVHPAQEAMTIRAEPRALEERMREVARMFTLRPKILKDLDPEQWEGIHLNYAVWQLLSQSADEKCLPGFTVLGEMDAARCCG